MPGIVTSLTGAVHDLHGADKETSWKFAWFELQFLELLSRPWSLRSIDVHALTDSSLPCTVFSLLCASEDLLGVGLADEERSQAVYHSSRSC